jgi:hypothetical protein
MKGRHGKKQFFITVQFTHCAAPIEVLMMTMALERRNVSNRKPSSAGAVKCRRKFLRFFPLGFQDKTYLAWERNYKWRAHERWESLLDRSTFRKLLRAGEYVEAAARAVRIESQTNLLFSFEKMALRDAVKSPEGARLFGRRLYDFLHGRGQLEKKFERWCEVVGELPRRQTRVLTWPVVTVFGFIASLETQIFLKPNVTREAAKEYGFDFRYSSRPGWETYASLLEFADVVRRDLREMRPRDLIDIQSFIWVLGSNEY